MLLVSLKDEPVVTGFDEHCSLNPLAGVLSIGEANIIVSRGKISSKAAEILRSSIYQRAKVNAEQVLETKYTSHSARNLGMSAIVKSEYPSERASSGQTKHASKKVKLEHNNSNDRKDNGKPTLALLQLTLTRRPGDEAMSNLMSNPAAHSPPSFTASEHTGIVGASNMAGKRRKRKRHQPHDASN